MKKNRVNLLYSVLFLSFVSFSGELLAKIEKRMTLISISDLHGHITPEYSKTSNGELIPYGGAEYLSSYINIIREKSKYPTVFLDGGDLFQGTIISNHSEGKPVIKFYNHVELDAAAIGNHEFDYGPVGPQNVPLNSEDDPRGALKERIKEAKFPFLAANIFFKESNKRPEWAKPSIMIERGGLKIGVVGAATEETPSTTEKRNLVGLRFDNPMKSITEEARRLREEGADFVILLIHAGAVCDKKEGIDEISSCHGELIDIAKNVPEGLFNGIVGGHTHRFLMKRIRNMAVMQSYPKGKSLIWATLSTNGKVYLNSTDRICGKVVPSGKEKFSCAPYIVEKSSASPMTPVYLGKEVHRDERVLEILKDDIELANKIRNRKLGVTLTSSMERSYYGESAVGNFTADFLFKGYADLADGSFTNNGGVRANLSEGPLTYGSVYDVLPFDNQASLIKVKGKALTKIVELGIKRNHSGISWSQVEFKATKCHVDYVKINGELVKEDKEYRLITNDYLANGGGGLASAGLKKSDILPLQKSGPIREKVVEELEKSGGSYSSSDFYDLEQPRQIIVGNCE